MKGDEYFIRLSDGCLHARCYYDGIFFPCCPCNDRGFCMMKLFDYPREFYHPFDGKNGWKCPCG